MPHSRPTETPEELQEIYFELFDTTTKLHLLKGTDSHLLEQSRTLLDAVLSNISELMVREEAQDTKISWWESDHWIFN